MSLESVANIAAILTAIVATGAASYYWCDRRQKRVKLEDYLKSEQKVPGGNTQHTVLHLMAELGLTEAEILHACFQSTHIKCLIRKNLETGLAERSQRRSGSGSQRSVWHCRLVDRALHADQRVQGSV